MPDEEWACIWCGESFPYRRHLKRHQEHWHTQYTAAEIERLIKEWPFIRARIESSGDLEDEAWMSVLDLEGALWQMASPDLQGRRNLIAQRQHAAAAVCVAARLLFEVTDDELKMAIGGDLDPSRLLRKAAAWGATRLAGGTQRECDDAFRRAG
jgi:hypothetical protein